MKYSHLLSSQKAAEVDTSRLIEKDKLSIYQSEQDRIWFGEEYENSAREYLCSSLDISRKIEFPNDMTTVLRVPRDYIVRKYDGLYIPDMLGVEFPKESEVKDFPTEIMNKLASIALENLVSNRSLSGLALVGMDAMHSAFRWDSYHRSADPSLYKAGLYINEHYQRLDGVQMRELVFNQIEAYKNSQKFIDGFSNSQAIITFMVAHGMLDIESLHKVWPSQIRSEMEALRGEEKMFRLFRVIVGHNTNRKKILKRVEVKAKSAREAILRIAEKLDCQKGELAFSFERADGNKTMTYMTSPDQKRLFVIAFDVETFKRHVLLQNNIPLLFS